MAKGKFDYFNALKGQVTYAVQEAELLYSYMNDFDPQKVPEWMTQMHDLETAGDHQIHEIFTHLAKEFLTPIDREDILQIAQRLDDIVDYIEDVIQQFYMYNVQVIYEKAKPMAEIILSATKALEEALTEFPQFRKASNLKDCIVQVNDLEEEADRLYAEGMAHLFRNHTDEPIFVMVWHHLFQRVERCVDACENVADMVDTVVLKNS